MIGLKRGTVTLVDHQESWHNNAARTISTLKEILGDVAIDIQHIGSTSIHNICAKPIIDIMVGIIDFNNILTSDILKKLSNYGFIHIVKSDTETRLFFAKGKDDIRTHHLHATIYSKYDWNNAIMFRDYLNSCDKLSRLYQSVKQKSATANLLDRDKYGGDKIELINQVLKEANDYSVLGNVVDVIIDKPLGSVHQNMSYPINYGYIKDGKWENSNKQEAYIIGADKSITVFNGEVIARIIRNDNNDDKLVIAPIGQRFTIHHIRNAVKFLEQDVKSEYIYTYHDSCGCALYSIVDEKVYYLLVNEYDDVWGFPKGHIHEGETYRETAKREMLEETGLSIDIPNINTIRFNYCFNNKVKCLVDIFPIKVEYINVENNTGEYKCKWFDYEEIMSISLHDGIGEVIDEIQMNL